MSSSLAYEHSQQGKPKTVYQWCLIALGSILAILLLGIPLLMVFVTMFSAGSQVVLSVFEDPDMLHAIGLTLFVALITVPVNLVFGILFAWLVTRFEFKGKKLLLILIDIPFAVSPVLAGLLYLLIYGYQHPVGSWLEEQGIQILFAWPGIVLVTLFVTCPFVARELIPVMINQGSQEDEAAMLLGASPWKMFYYVTLPNIRWPLLYGVILTHTRAIGEFGAVSVVSGAIRGETYTLPLQVELFYQDYNTVGAFSAAALLTLITISTLLLKNGLQWRVSKHKNDAYRGEYEN